MADRSEEAKARAEGQFRKRQQRSEEAEKAHADIAAQARALDKGTARLKALRLAKEAADREAAKHEPAKQQRARANDPLASDQASRLLRRVQATIASPITAGVPRMMPVARNRASNGVPSQFSSGRLSRILDRNVAPRSVASAIS